MRQKLYGNHITPCCEVCSSGRRSSDNRAILCPRKGVMPLHYHCRRFSYDPLRRIPSPPPTLSQHDEKEFAV